MCGIAGILTTPGRTPDRALLVAMAGELAHRGPDGVGLFTDRAFGMVNTRLSIVDLEGGDQPLSNEDRRYWVMQNGEIYNSPELNEELAAKGHRFSTRCDTETIVHAYEEWGVDCLSHFNGPFAFAIWDTAKSELFLARDRFGIRPLFVAELDGGLVFGSECKSILRHPAASRQIDPLGLVETLELWASAPDRSAFAGIRELAPGHYLLAQPGRILEEKEWWDLPFADKYTARRESAEVLAEELLELLRDSASIRLRADVPVGAYLSGGLDSSATAAIVRQMTTQTLRSFAVQFQDPLFDERTFQDRMAKQLGTELSSIEVDGKQIADVFPAVVHFAEKPILRTAPAPLFHLSKLARDSGFKVVLTGEGADEVFAGYHIFQEDKIRRFWAKHPESKSRPLLLRRLHPYLAQDLSRTGAFLTAFFGRHLTEVDDPLYSHRIRFENTGRTRQFLTPEVAEAARAAGDPEERLIARLPSGFSSFSSLGRAQYLEIKTFLEGYLLHAQGDRMLMAHSIEGRFPFLDYRLAEFAARVPDRLRLRGLREKYLLRKAVGPLLPPEIGQRKKHPYRAPILRAFMGKDAPDYVRRVLDPVKVKQTGLFNEEMVERLTAKCSRSLERGVGETDEMALVALISTMLLHERFIEDPVLAPPRPPTKEVHLEAGAGQA